MWLPFLLLLQKLLVLRKGLGGLVRAYDPHSSHLFDSSHLFAVTAKESLSISWVSTWLSRLAQK